MSSIGAAPRAPVSLSPARAEASRRNGAKSKGPKTAEGKARSAQNALKHGLRAQKHIVLPGEDAAEFAALEAALIEELAPEGMLQSVLAQRVVAAVWRLARAERLEVELFAENRLAGRSLGHALIRDCNGGARSFDTLLRYRGGTLAELWRALRTLKALQAERATQAAPRTVAPEASAPAPARAVDVAALPAPPPRDGAPTPTKQPDKPESRATPSDSGGASKRTDPTGDELRPAPGRLPTTPPTPAGTVPCARSIEPTPKQGDQPARSFPSQTSAPNGSASLLAGTALASVGRPGVRS
jgi:hypothetical protein